MVVSLGENLRMRTCHQFRRVTIILVPETQEKVEVVVVVVSMIELHLKYFVLQFLKVLFDIMNPLINGSRTTM
mgnify:CR=1 FL=1